MHVKTLQRTDVYNPITYDCFSDLLDIKSPPLHIKICTLCVFFSSHALLAKTLVEACQVIWSYQLVGKAGLSIH